MEKFAGHSFKLLDIVKKFGPLSENSSPLLVPQAGYGPVWKMTWSVHYHALSLESCFLTTNRLSLGIVCSVLCVIKGCSYLCSVHVQQLSHWRRCIVGGPRILCLCITFFVYCNWATCLKGLEPLLWGKWHNVFFFCRAGSRFRLGVFEDK